MERDIDIRCPKCGSKNVIKLNSDDKIENQIASKTKYLQYLCCSCGYSEQIATNILADYTIKTILKIIKTISIIATLIYPLLLIIAGVRKYKILLYYGISTYFLRFDIQDILVNVFVCVVLIVLLPMTSIVLWKLSEVFKNNRWLVKVFKLAVIIIEFPIYAFIVCNGFNYICNIHLNNSTNLFTIAFIIISFVAFIGILNIMDKKYDTNSQSKVKKLYYKFKRILAPLCIICVVIFLFNISIFLWFNFFGDNLEFQTYYDTVTYKNEKYVVLTTYQNSLIVSSYSKNNPSRFHNHYSNLYDCIIFTKSYLVIPIDDINMKHEYLGKTYIEKNKTLLDASK